MLIKINNVGFEYPSVIRSDFNEIINLKIIYKLNEKLNNHDFNISTDHYRINIDVYFIKKFVSLVNELTVNADKLHSKDLKKLKTVLTNSFIIVCFHILTIVCIQICFVLFKNVY